MRPQLSLGSTLHGDGLGGSGTGSETRLMRLRAVGGPDRIRTASGKAPGAMLTKVREEDAPLGRGQGGENGHGSRGRRAWLSHVAGAQVQGSQGHLRFPLSLALLKTFPGVCQRS